MSSSPPGTGRPEYSVLEVKKTSNPVLAIATGRAFQAFRAQYKYEFAALIECEHGPGRGPTAAPEWLAKRKRRPMRRR